VARNAWVIWAAMGWREAATI